MAAALVVANSGQLPSLWQLTAVDPLIIMGDFNIHVDRGTDRINAARFVWVSRNM